MKTSHIVAFLIVFVVLLVYAQYLKVQVALQESRFAIVESEKQQLIDTEYSLKKDIERARNLQTDVKLDLESEEKTYRLLKETLGAIQAKLEGSDRLEGAVSELEKEYSELVVEAKLLEEARK